MAPLLRRSRTLAVAVTTGMAVAATTTLVLTAGASTADDPAPGAATGDGAPSSSSAGTVDRIRGSVGPGFEISVAPRRVTPGRYRLVVRDQSTMHNWHITGPDVNEKTTVAFQGTQRFAVRLTPGRYRIVCDPHATTMITHLRVRR